MRYSANDFSMAILFLLEQVQNPGNTRKSFGYSKPPTQ
jgi:hypothetical protein